MIRRLVPLLLVLALAGSAEAWDYRALGGLDFLLATRRGDDGGADGLTAAQFGLTLRGEIRNLKDRYDLKLDFNGRESILGNNTFNHLFELHFTARRLRGILDVRVGRLRTPGGFWLIADGAMLTLHYTRWLSHSVYGGLRSFTTGRRNSWMSNHPVALPLAGTSFQVRHRLVEASLTFTWARDAVDLRTGRGFVGEGPAGFERHVTDEFFLDGQVLVFPHPTLTLSAGASLGTRYDVQWNATNPAGATLLGLSTLGAVSAWGIAEYRPVRRLRLQYTFNFERVRLFQSTLLVQKADGTPVSAADGSFQDHTLRAVYLLWRGLKLEARYRLRYRANTDVQHRVLGGLFGDDLWRGLGGFLSVGVDINQGIDLGPLADDPVSRRVANRVIYNAGLSFTRHFLDLRAGILFTDGIGSGLARSAPGAAGAPPIELFPYVLETNRVAFVRGFALFWKMFAGLDFEANVDAAQFRLFAQVGASL
jgi:hypothetical protein